MYKLTTLLCWQIGRGFFIVEIYSKLIQFLTCKNMFWKYKKIIKVYLLSVYTSSNSTSFVSLRFCCCCCMHSLIRIEQSIFMF